MQHKMDGFQPANPHQLQREMVGNFGVKTKKKRTKEWIH
jgi:hypothetical protein